MKSGRRGLATSVKLKSLVRLYSSAYSVLEIATLANRLTDIFRACFTPADKKARTVENESAHNSSARTVKATLSRNSFNDYMTQQLGV